MIIESIEQSSSSKGKEVVETTNYVEYVKLKHDNEKLKKEFEEFKTHNTIVLETLDHDGDLILENEKLKEEYTNLKVNHDNLVISHEFYPMSHMMPLTMLLRLI